MTLNTEFYFLSPVEVVRVTKDNLQEVAEWCEGRVAETESRRVPGRMDAYVWVPTPKGTGISWAFPGMFVTKRMVLTIKGDTRITFAVFRRDYFEKNYFQTPMQAVEGTWEKGLKRPGELSKAVAPDERNVTVNVMGDEVMSLDQAKAVLENINPGTHVKINQVHPDAPMQAQTRGYLGLPEQRELLHEEAVEREAAGSLEPGQQVEVVGEPENPTVKKVVTPGEGELTTPGEAEVDPPVKMASRALTNDELALLKMPTEGMDGYREVFAHELTLAQLNTIQAAGGVV